MLNYKQQSVAYLMKKTGRIPRMKFVETMFPISQSGSRKLAEESYELAIYGVDEIATNAAQHYLLGRICLAEGDTNTAITHFVKTIITGDKILSTFDLRSITNHSIITKY